MTLRCAQKAGVSSTRGGGGWGQHAFVRLIRRQIIKQVDLHISDIGNGVWLSKEYHQVLNKNSRAYGSFVNDTLQAAVERARGNKELAFEYVLEAIDDIRQELLSGRTF